jgi:hypothetical protein
MKVLSLIEINDTVLISTTVAEADYAAWLVGTTYAIGDRVIVLSSHKIYQSLQNSNTGNDPLDDPQNDENNLPVWWVEVSATNRYKPFDGQRNNLAVDTSPMNYTIMSDTVVDGISVLNVDCQEINVTVTFDMIEVYNETLQMVSRSAANWYDYFFQPFQQKRNVYIDGLPPLIGAEISITLTRDSGSVSVGVIAVGSSLYIGKAVYGATSDIKSYSKSEPNQFGVTRLVRRTPKVQTEQLVEVDKSYTTFLYELREALESVPAVWSTVDEIESDFFNAYIISGIYDRFKINAENPSQTTVNLALREL